MSDAVLTPSRIAERRSLQLRTHWTSQLARLLRGAVPTAIGLVILIVMLFPVLWLVDTKGRRVGVPTEKLAYVEVGEENPDKRVGFSRL